MAITHVVDPEKRRATLVLTGKESGETMAHALVALEADEQWQPGYDRVWEGRAMRGLSVILEHLGLIGDLVARERLHARKTAIVAAPGNDYEVARLYEAQNRGRGIRVFLYMDEAERWLADE